MRLRRTTLAAVMTMMTTMVVPAESQAQRELQNLRFFDPDVGRDSIIRAMRDFSFALGVRCQYCHVGGDGRSLEGVVFESDEDPDKEKARFMLRMVETLNTSMLPLMAGRDEAAVTVSCKTCHRGLPRPALLTDVLRATLDEHGADSAAAQYRSLREQTASSGTFDFGEWETNTLAEEFFEAGRHRDAIAIYELNLEFHPRSVSILLSLGDLYERIEEPATAIGYYERALALAPEHPRARARLEALRGR